jgi:hypothetical protein
MDRAGPAVVINSRSQALINSINKQRLMGRVEKIYITVLPMTPDEYAVGQLYTVDSMTAADPNERFRVEVVESMNVVDETLGKAHKTKKVMHLGDKIPGFLRKLIPPDACIMEEASLNTFRRCRTRYRNRYFNHETFNMEFHTVVSKFEAMDQDSFEYDTAGIERSVQHLHEEVVDSMYDPTVFYHEETQRGRLGKNWIDEYRDRNRPMVMVQRHITVDVNSVVMGWVAGEVEKAMRNIIRSAQQRIFCTMDKWYGKSIEDVQKIVESPEE